MSRTRVDPRIEHTQALVVEATAELLATEGFERITIDAIAERSGVARSTIYRHWPDRAQLLVHAFMVVLDKEDTPDTGSLVGDFRVIANSFCAGMTNEDWGRMLPSLVGASAHDTDLRRALTEFHSARRDEAMALIRRAQERGEISGGIDVLAALERFAGPFFLRHLITGDPVDAEFAERQVEGVCRDVGAPYSPPD